MVNTATFEIFTRFRLSHFGEDPDEITRVVGLAPTQTWRTGERTHGDRGIVLKENVWQLELPFDQALGSEVDQHVLRLLDLLHPHAQAIAALAPSIQRMISCAVYDENRSVSVFLNPPTVARIAALGCSFDIDCYSFVARRA